MSHFITWLFSAKSGLCGDSFYNTYTYNTANDNFMTFTLTTNPSTQIGTFDAIITNFHEQSGEILLFERQSSRLSLMMIFYFSVVIRSPFDLDPDAACLDGWWKCGNGRCVDPSSKCNTFDNCGDNTDETYEKCKPTSGLYLITKLIF